MSFRGVVFQACISVVFVLSLSAFTDAQASRTWVSGVGDDANPCSRTAPCKTFAGAISKTAINGEINCLDPAGYGAVTITKSITIDCTGTFGSILASMTTGIVINLTADSDVSKTVRIRGLHINGVGNGANGIRIMFAWRVYVENTVIDGFAQHGISVSSAGDSRVVVQNSTIRNNAGAGIYGVPGAAADIVVSKSLLAENGIGVQAGPNATVRISGNTIVHNTTGLSVTGTGKIVSFKDNVIDGNGTNGSPTSTVTLQ